VAEKEQGSFPTQTETKIAEFFHQNNNNRLTYQKQQGKARKMYQKQK
jgi:hypothetical protein